MDVKGLIQVFLCTLAVTGLVCSAAEAQVDQTGLAQRLRSTDVSERNQAFTESVAIPPDEIGSALSVAYIDLLHEMNGIVLQAAASEIALASVESPEFVSALSRRVAQLNDPGAIRALSRAYYGGRLASEALADFGAAAVPDLLAVVDSPGRNYNLANYGLKTLALVVVKHGGTGRLSLGLRRGIVESTARRLRTPGYFTTLWAAIDLAAVLDDPGLLVTVRSLATDRDEVRARGISDPEIISMTQERAARRLSGG